MKSRFTQIGFAKVKVPKIMATKIRIMKIRFEFSVAIAKVIPLVRRDAAPTNKARIALTAIETSAAIHQTKIS